MSQGKLKSLEGQKEVRDTNVRVLPVRTWPAELSSEGQRDLQR